MKKQPVEMYNSMIMEADAEHKKKKVGDTEMIVKTRMPPSVTSEWEDHNMQKNVVVVIILLWFSQLCCGCLEGLF